MKPIFQISSPVSDRQDDQLLVIRIGERHLGFAISNTDASELYQLSFYKTDELDGPAVAQIVDAHPELGSAFSRVLIGFDHPQSILVPSSVYKKEDAPDMLKTIFGVNGMSSILNEPVNGWQLENVFAVPQDVEEYIRSRFNSPVCRHQYTIGIKSLITPAEESSMLVDFRTDEFSAIVVNGNKLLLAQTFFYATPADVIYNLLSICQQLSVPQQSVVIHLSGLIEKDSALYREIYQYFLHIHFRAASWTVPGEQEDREYPSHFFTSLNDLAICAL